jgi:hypothetical protein
MKKGIQLSGLIFACPDNEELLECPFREIRMLNIGKRMSLFESMDEKDFNRLKLKHYMCMVERNAFL